MNPIHFKLRDGIVLAAIALAACQQHKAAERETAPDARPGISVSDGRLTLPAVKGNPGAAYFSVVNGGKAPTSIVAVHVDGAGKAEMHESKDGTMAALTEVPIAAGETVRFVQGGKHVMLFDLDGKLAAGGTTELTLTFAGGDKASAPLKIEPAGGAGAMSDMPGMGHGEER